MQICPCCKRAMPRVKGKTAQQRALMQDLKRAEYSIHCLKLALFWPNEHESFRVAVRDELNRMTRALTDHNLLWRIYRRSSKTPCYASQETFEVAA